MFGPEVESSLCQILGKRTKVFHATDRFWPEADPDPQLYCGAEATSAIDPLQTVASVGGSECYSTNCPSKCNQVDSPIIVLTIHCTIAGNRHNLFITINSHEERFAI